MADLAAPQQVLAPEPPQQATPATPSCAAQRVAGIATPSEAPQASDGASSQKPSDLRQVEGHRGSVKPGAEGPSSGWPTTITEVLKRPRVEAGCRLSPVWEEGVEPASEGLVRALCGVGGNGSGEATTARKRPYEATLPGTDDDEEAKKPALPEPGLTLAVLQSREVFGKWVKPTVKKDILNKAEGPKDYAGALATLGKHVLLPNGVIQKDDLELDLLCHWQVAYGQHTMWASKLRTPFKGQLGAIGTTIQYGRSVREAEDNAAQRIFYELFPSVQPPEGPAPMTENTTALGCMIVFDTDGVGIDN